VASARKVFFVLFLASAFFASAQGSEEELRRRVVAAAAKYRGTPYMYGAESPSAFDCSGFVRYVYREAAGITLPRSSKGIFAAGIPIDAREAKPGDVFVYDTVGGSPSHVAIYLGDGSVIHAVSQGPRTGVIVSPASDSYFPHRLIAARSFLDAAAAPVRKTTTAPEYAAPVAVAKPTLAPAVHDADEAPVADIGFSIPAERISYTDRIPAAAGTKIAFTLTNGTGKDGTFIVIFYKSDPKFSESKEIHREKARISAGGSLELPAYFFSEPGIYKLIVKDTWNAQLLERIFTVKER